MSDAAPPTESTDRLSIIDVDDALETRMRDDEEEGSHTELEPHVFHPSQVGYAPWLLMVNKLGLDDKSGLLGTFKMGELIHEYVQDTLVEQGHIDPEHVEGEIDFAEGGLRFLGHYDLYDPQNDVVYDIKSRSSWYNFEPPVDRHVDQLHVYMRGLDADYGQVVYVSKKDMEVRTWPEGAPFSFDPPRWYDIMARCTRVRAALESEGLPSSEDEIPFEKPTGDHPQAYFADSAELDFGHLPNGGGSGEPTDSAVPRIGGDDE